MKHTSNRFPSSGNCFAIAMELLLDNESHSEMVRWFSTLWQIGNMSKWIPTKKRVALAYEALFTSDVPAGHKLTENRLTVSFFCGAFSTPSTFTERYRIKFDMTLLESRYYALGVLFRNYLYINQIEPQLRIIEHVNTLKATTGQQLELTDKFLSQCLTILNDDKFTQSSTPRGKPHVLEQGLKLLTDQPSFSQANKRRTLWETVEFMNWLEQIRKETRLANRRVLIQNLRLKTRFEGVPTICEPLVNETDIDLEKAGRSFHAEIRANIEMMHLVSVKAERENEMLAGVKDEEMELCIEPDYSQTEHKRVPLGDLKNRFSSSQKTKTLDSEDSDCIAVD